MRQSEKMKRFGLAVLMCAALSTGVFAGCSGTTTTSSSSASAAASAASISNSTSATASASASASTTKASATVSAESALDTSNMFSERDLAQTADTSSAKEISLKSGENVTISEEGTYVISGTAENVTITVAADNSSKVQLVLNGVTITNTDTAAIFVESADKVFVTTAAGTTNTLSTTGTFANTSDSNVDGVIYASDDIVLNGAGTLVIKSSDNGIVGKDDLKITGGTYDITAAGHAIEGKDSVAIADGTFTIDTQKDGIHAENSDDTALGYVYIADGSFSITAGGDGIEGTSVVQIDGGDIAINAAEGIEGTYVQINGGTVNIKATDDGINATIKSTAYSVMLQINDGSVSVDMGQGDTDALDSNGNLSINGGTINITAQSPFDYDGTGEFNGGTVTVNGEQVTELTNSMMGGGKGGAMGGKQNK